MSFILSGLPCVSPRTLAHHLNQPGIRALSHLWVNKANSFRTQVGAEPGRAYLLMKYEHFRLLNRGDGWNKLHTLVIQDRKDNRVTVKELVIIGGTCVTPGAEDDPRSCYCVELADVRWLAWNPYFGNTVNKAYNVRAPAGGEDYYEDSLDGGASWTWQRILEDLWAATDVEELGNAPTLNGLVNGTPENIRFHHVSAWQAFNEVLKRIGRALTFSYSSRNHRIFDIGGNDPDFSKADKKHRAKRITDLYPKESYRAKIPAKVRVAFHNISKHYGTEKTTGWAADSQWSVTPITTVDVNDPTTTKGIQENSSVTLWDDLAAIIDFDGTVTNQSALDARAAERAAQYYAMIGAGSGTGEWLWRQYRGFIKDNGFLPGLSTTGLAFLDTGTGWKTEVLNTPGPIQALAIGGNSQLGQAMDFGTGGGSEKLIERLRTPNFGRAQLLSYPPTDQLIRVTSTTPVATDVYNGRVVRFRPSDLSGFGLESCWLFFANGGSPTGVDQIVGARLNGTATYNSELRPLYIVTSGGGGGSTSVESFVYGGGGLTSIPNGVMTRISWVPYSVSYNVQEFWHFGEPYLFRIPIDYEADTRVVVSATGHLNATDIQKSYGCRWLINPDEVPDIGDYSFDAGGQCFGGPIKLHEERNLTVQPGDVISFWVFSNDPIGRFFAPMDARCERM